MNRSANARRAGEHRAQLCMIRLLCALSIWRIAVTRLLPLCGSATWWTALLCLLPGFGTAALLRLVMRLTGTATLTEAIRACLGRLGAWGMAAILVVLLLTEGISCMTALITLFTEGIGTRGTQLTLAILTGVLLLMSLQREGLPRAVYLLRYVMTAAALLGAAYLIGDAKPDGVYPLYGEGMQGIRQAVQAGASLAWTIPILLTVPSPKGQGRLRTGVVAALMPVGALLLLVLTVPHELLLSTQSLAQQLLLSVKFMPNALRVILQSLMMLVFFLGIGACARLASSALCMPMKSLPEWLPYGVVAALILTQAADTRSLWEWLGQVEPWLLVPLAGMALLCLPIALFRRKNA